MKIAWPGAIGVAVMIEILRVRPVLPLRKILRLSKILQCLGDRVKVESLPDANRKLETRFRK